MAEQETTAQETTDDNTVKVSFKSMKANQEEEVYKVELSKPPNNEAEEVEAPEEGPDANDAGPDQTQEEVQPEEEVQPTDGDVKVEEPEVEEPVAEETETPTLPDNIQKLVDFMNETGGDINDYVRLNRDVASLDGADLMDEYYKATKPHLSSEERSFLLETTFGFDEEIDDAKDIKRKKIALKEEQAKARQYLENQKTKYYDEIKATDNLTAEQKKAVDFFNRYNKETEQQKKLSEATVKAFQQRTEKVFGDGFEGFEYQIGDNKFRYNVKNAQEVKATQSDLNNFVNKFVGEDNTIQDAAGYHKGLFTAMNADAIAQHFYEQGKADAIKDQVAKDKNVNTSSRQTHGETEVGGIKYKVLGDSARDFKIKRRKR